MWNAPSKELLDRIPRLYETENIPLEQKNIYVHFFLIGSDWFVAEFNGDDLFWGFVVLHGDFRNAEWGFFSLKELQQIQVAGMYEVEYELEEYWKIRPAAEVELIRIANGWPRIKKLPATP